MYIQNRENAMFDFASNKAENVIEAIKSLSNGHKLDPRLIDSMATARLGNPTCNPRIIEDKVHLMDEIDFQNLSDVSGWGYVEKHMPMVKDYIVKKCAEENLDLYSFIFRETDNSINLNKKKADLNQIGELSGHSFRVGAALDLLDKNIPLEKIMLRGGWKSETSTMRYLQSWNDSNWLIIN